MEEAKLIRMAAAISEYTISSMLRETVSGVAETLNQAAPTVQTLPGIPQHLLNDIARAQQALEQLERSAVNYQKERAATWQMHRKLSCNTVIFEGKRSLIRISIPSHRSVQSVPFVSDCRSRKMNMH